MLAGTCQEDLPNRLAGLELEGQDTREARGQRPGSNSTNIPQKKLQPHGKEGNIAHYSIPFPLAS